MPILIAALMRQWQRKHTIESAAVKVGRCARTITAALSSGELCGERRGNRTFISDRELTRWAATKGLITMDAVTPQELFELARELVREAQLGGRKDAA